MMKHKNDLDLLVKRTKRYQTSLFFVITTWVVTIASGWFTYYILNYSVNVAIMSGINAVIFLNTSTIMTLRYFHLEPLAREIVYLNNEINRLKERDNNV